MKISAQDFLFINYSKHVWLDQHVWVHFSLEVDLENFLLCKITASSFSLTSLFFFVVVFCDWKWREVRYEVTIAVRRSPWANRNGGEKVFPFSLTLISLNPNSTWKWSTENKKKLNEKFLCDETWKQTRPNYNIFIFIYLFYLTKENCNLYILN